jgi:four helix bundle protein
MEEGAPTHSICLRCDATGHVCERLGGLTGQMQRAAVSIMANVAEGFERGKPKEYLQFLLIAKASCAEVRSHLYVALDSGYLDEPTFPTARAGARNLTYYQRSSGRNRTPS